MTRIRVKQLRIHNFLSFHDEEWDFDNTSRLVLVKGVNKDINLELCMDDGDGKSSSNGSGKSAWSHALMYALFGQLNGKIHNSNLKNKHCDDVSSDGYKMSVSIDVDTHTSKNDVRHWRITRGLQKGSSSTIALQLFSMETEGGDWKDISKSSSANTQKFIEDVVLCMNFEMYQRLVMLSIEDKYIFFKLNASQKRDFVEMMFDTSVYSKMYKMMSEDLKTKNLLLQNLKTNHVKLEKTREVCEDEIGKYKANVNDKISSTRTEIDGIKEKIGEFDPQFAEIEEQQAVLKEALDKVRDARAKLEKVKSKFNETITNSRIEISNFNSTISHHEREIGKHKEVLGMICDDCRAAVSKFYSLDVYRDEISRLKDRISTEEGKIQETSEKMSNVLEMDEELKGNETKRISELSELQVKERNLQFQKNGLMKSVLDLERTVDELKASIDDEKRIPSWGIYQKTLADIESVEKEIKDETMHMCLIKIGSDMVSPDAIRRNIISKMVASINAMINSNLEELNANFTCVLSQDMNDYEIESSGGELDFTNLSLGEQMKLVISSQLAFRRFLMSRFNVCMNVMIIDEVVDRALDSVSIRKLLEMLLQLSQKENTNVSIISHRSEVENMFNDLPETQLMVVQKKDSISRIVRDFSDSTESRLS